MIGCDDNYDQTDAYIRKLEAERDAALAKVAELETEVADVRRRAQEQQDPPAQLAQLVTTLLEEPKL